MVLIVDGRLLANISIGCKDLVAANKIFGPDINALKGRTISHKTPRLQMKIASVPVAIMTLYCQYTFVSDILFVNRIPFLISIRLNLNFVTVESLENCRIPILVKAVHRIKKIYALRGFSLAFIKMDHEFKPLCADISISNIFLNFCALNEHTP